MGRLAILGHRAAHVLVVIDFEPLNFCGKTPHPPAEWHCTSLLGSSQTEKALQVLFFVH